MHGDNDEIGYYRAIEDRFAALRGVPHTLSPKDFQLMRRWWSDHVPLAAVTGGLTEVFARRRERGEPDTVVSLSYCRHAVAAHARRLADAHVGNAGVADGLARSRADDVSALAADLRHRARETHLSSGIAAALERTAVLVDAATELDDVALDEHLFSLEALMLDACWNALDDRERSDVEAVADAAAATSTTDDSRARARRAARDRELRRRLDLPRLEVP